MTLTRPAPQSDLGNAEVLGRFTERHQPFASHGVEFILVGRTRQASTFQSWWTGRATDIPLGRLLARAFGARGLLPAGRRRKRTHIARDGPEKARATPAWRSEELAVKLAYKIAHPRA